MEIKIEDDGLVETPTPNSDDIFKKDCKKHWKLHSVSIQILIISKYEKSQRWENYLTLETHMFPVRLQFVVWRNFSGMVVSSEKFIRGHWDVENIRTNSQEE